MSSHSQTTVYVPSSRIALDNTCEICLKDTDRATAGDDWPWSLSYSAPVTYSYLDALGETISIKRRGTFCLAHHLLNTDPDHGIGRLISIYNSLTDLMEANRDNFTTKAQKHLDNAIGHSKVSRILGPGCNSIDQSSLRDKFERCRKFAKSVPYGKFQGEREDIREQNMTTFEKMLTTISGWEAARLHARTDLSQYQSSGLVLACPHLQLACPDWQSASRSDDLSQTGHSQGATISWMDLPLYRPPQAGSKGQKVENLVVMAPVMEDPEVKKPHVEWSDVE